MSCVIPIAIRYALNSARAEVKTKESKSCKISIKGNKGNKDEWYQLGKMQTIYIR